MNANPPEHNREELEARVTALLLGELDASEAAEVGRAIETDPELAKSKARMERTIKLIKEAVGERGATDNACGDTPRLSDARRKRLRELFGSGNALSRRVRSRTSMDWAVPLGIAAAFVILMGFASLLLGVGSLGKAKARGARPSLVSSPVSRLDGVPAAAVGQRDYSRRFAGGRAIAEQEVEVRAVEAVASSPQEVRKGTPVVGVPSVPAGQRAEEAKGAEPRNMRVYLPMEAQVSENLSDQADKAANADVSGKEVASLGRPVGAPAAANGVQAPMDIRMLMRYGLLPRDSKASVQDRSLAEDVRARTGAAGKPVAGAGVEGRLGFKPMNGRDAAGTEVAERYAGLAKNESVSSSKFVPVLGDSPAVGQAFSFADKEGALDSLGVITNAVPEPQPEVLSVENPFSTFSLNISDVSFRLAAASLENGAIPAPASIRSEEFINAFDYRDPEPAAGMPMAFNWERAHYPFAHNRDVIRFSIRTAAFGRDSVRPLNLVLLLDSSGSMERADRVLIIREALRVLAQQLRPEDVVSVVGFARTARLWVDGLSGDRAEELVARVGNLTPEGGTNLEDALKLAYETAARHFLPNGVNRIVLLTDGAANLGDVEPESLKRVVTDQRKRGIALDCFGIGWEGYNDELLEVLSRHGDGRYGFVNTPEEAATDFAAKLAGALQVAAADVKVQVEFNPHRVVSWRQIGYAKHKLTAEQFRDNTVDAAEVAAAESGNALYVIQTKPDGEGNICVVRVRYREPASGLYREMSWPVPYTGIARPLENASAAMRLAVVAGAFSERLASNPYASEVKIGPLLSYLNGVPEAFDLDPRPRKLEWMLREYQRISGE
ncbi:MAG TPA: von Willebrand factor type A domain-containing protein [Verrucomicrobiota bacterium]|nr:von Willebrand factor type A domain-containing protein [Verrucomicrobiota bacterium]